jgi:hypothetical protein
MIHMFLKPNNSKILVRTKAYKNKKVDCLDVHRLVKKWQKKLLIKEKETA